MAVALFAIAALLPATMSAYDFEEGGIYYDVRNGEAVVTYKSSGLGSYQGRVVIPETVTHDGHQYAVTTIGKCAFSYSSITEVEIPNSIITIEDHAFKYCGYLQSVVVPNSVRTLGRCVFHSCGNMTSAVVGDQVQVIDEYEFQYCYKLTDVILGKSVNRLEIKTFFDCPSLKNVTCLAANPPSMYAYYSFCDEAYAYATLHVNGASMQAYKDDPNWGLFHRYQSLTLAEGLSLDKMSLTLHGGESYQLNATVVPSDAGTALNWSSSDEQVATVNPYGKVTAVAAGHAVITATTTDGTDLKATCAVRVLSDGVQTNNMLTLPLMQTVERGKPFELPIAMVNNAAITALQFDLILPEDIDLAADGDDYIINLLDTRATPAHALYVRAISPNVYRVIVSSTQSEPFVGNEGNLMMLHLNADAVEGEYCLALTNVVLADAAAVTYYAPDVSAIIEVESYAKGDANGDGLINVGDYVTTANYILGLNPDPFVFSAADVDENGSIDVGDLVGIANIVMGDFTMSENAPCFDDVTLHGESMMADDGRVIVTLDMDNVVAVAAMQMDLSLPKGMTLTQANLSSRASRHSLVVNELSDGSLRLLASSTMNDVVSGNEGALLTLVLEGSTDANAAVNVSDVLLAEADMTTHGVSPFGVSIGSSAVKELRSDVRIYAQAGNIVIETPVETPVEVIMVNGMKRTFIANAGVNTYPATSGINIVRVAGKVAKLTI